MATLQAATTSTGAIVSDPQTVRELCENYCFGTLNWEVTDDGELTIWGYDNFEVYEARENGLPDYDGGIVTHEFLRELATHLETGEELDIQTAGFTNASRCWRSGTSFEAMRSSTRISAGWSRSTGSVVRPPERGAGRHTTSVVPWSDF
jgi:hypothetical protein